MPIISRVEARSFRGRMLYAGIIAVLTIGSLTMIYPFAIMISGSLRSPMDQADMGIVPGFLVRHNKLLQKFLEYKYNENVTTLSEIYQYNYYSFDTVDANADQVSPQAIEAFRQYIGRDDLPMHWVSLGGVYSKGNVPANLRELRQRLQAKYNGDLTELSASLGSPADSWLSIVMVQPRWFEQRFDSGNNSLWDEYFKMSDEADPAMLYPTPITGFFLETMVYPVYGNSSDEAVKGLNKDHGTTYESMREFHLSATVPAADGPDAGLREAWIEFVHDELNPSFVALRDPDVEAYRAFLRNSYSGRIDQLNQSWGQKLTSFEQIELPQGQRWLQKGERQDYEQYIASLPVEALRLQGPEYDWPQWFAQQAGSPITDPAQAPPMRDMVVALEDHYVANHSGALRTQFSFSNYVTVWEELALEGRALYNTVIYCILAIVAALLINPLAAYGLSRFQLRGTYKILLLLMATVAFPPMVTLIPQFILLRNLNLMNTMFALVLPLMANGYLIFLLKGFFDSLPQELFEAAKIDGASETRMFFQFAMALSKPILAVLALQTFTAAYASFMYPLLVAPDQDMWLIAVWLYQFQQRASTPAVYASVMIASIPTLVIFLFVQRTIMRGIVVPTEK